MEFSSSLFQSIPLLLSDFLRDEVESDRFIWQERIPNAVGLSS
jgi:hypothetical protein